MEIINIKNLSYFYSGIKKAALNNINFTISSGDFLVVLGENGSGKTTLLKMLKPSLTPYGKTLGNITFFSENLKEISPLKEATNIAYLSQNKDEQIVTDKVYHELAFGLESLGASNKTIKKRVAEMAAFFGIEHLFFKNVNELSDGQKQLVSLASVMVLNPKILILDEPTAMLDPIAAQEFLTAVKKINQELGITVLIAEHRLDIVLPYATKALVLNNGSVKIMGSVQEVIKNLKNTKSQLYFSLPTAIRVWQSVNTNLPCPLTIKEGRQFLKNHISTNNITKHNIELKNNTNNLNQKAIALKNINFKYQKNDKYILNNLNLTAYFGETLCLLGGNGAGKSTILKLITNIIKENSGKVNIYGKAAYLPQNPKYILTQNTVLEELQSITNNTEKLTSIINTFGLNNILNMHPFDISGGQQQKVALAKIILINPNILLLDEPTTALDANFKITFGQILKNLNAKQKCVIIITHDIDFAAEYATRCALLFNGEIAAISDTKEFFNNNLFYTTAANIMARNIIKNAVTCRDIISALNGKEPVINNNNHKNNIPMAPPPNVPPAAPQNKSNTLNKKKSKKTTLLSTLFIILIPITIFLSNMFFGQKYYYFTALLVCIESMMPFFLNFEGKKPKTAELVIIATLCALGVAGRAAFFMLQQFKPVLALTVITGVALGANSGFLVGSLTMLLSNIMFAQGPWSPFQMFAMGLIGFLSGIIFNKFKLKSNKYVLCAFSAFCAIFLYGGILNPIGALIWGNNNLNLSIIMLYYLQGLPMDIIHAGASVIFIYFLGEPIIFKLNRIKTKFGLLQ